MTLRGVDEVRRNLLGAVLSRENQEKHLTDQFQKGEEREGGIERERERERESEMEGR